MNSATLQIAIEVDDKGSVKIQKFGQTAESAGKAAEKSFDSVNKSMQQSSNLINSQIAAYETIIRAEQTKSQALQMMTSDQVEAEIKAEEEKTAILKQLNEEQYESARSSYDKIIDKLEEVGAVAQKVIEVISKMVLAFDVGSQFAGEKGGIASAGVVLAAELAKAFQGASAEAADLNDKMMKVYATRQQMVALGITEKSINADINALIGDQLSSWSKIRENLPDIVKDFLRLEETASTAIGFPDMSLNKTFEDIGGQIDAFISSLEKPKSAIEALYETATEKQLTELAKQLVNDRDYVREHAQTQTEAQDALAQLYVKYTLDKQRILSESAQAELKTYQTVMESLGTTVGSNYSESAMSLVIAMMKVKYAELLDAQEKSNAAILNSTEAAHTIRLAVEQKFGDDLAKIARDNAVKAREAALGADINQAQTKYDEFQKSLTSYANTGHAARIAAITKERDETITAYKLLGKTQQEIAQVNAAFNERLAAENKPDQSLLAAQQEIERLKESWVDMEKSLNLQIAKTGVDELSGRLMDIQDQAERLAKQFAQIPEAGKKIEDWAKTMSTTAIVQDDKASTSKSLANLQQEENEINAIVKAYTNLVSKYNLANETQLQFAAGQKIINAAFDAGNISAEEMANAIDLLSVSLQGAKADKIAEFYSTITGYDDQYRQNKLDSIEAMRKADIARYGDVEAANQKANDFIGKMDQDLFDRKAKLASGAFGDMENAFTSLSTLWEKGSSQSNQMLEAAKAMAVAQKAVAVVSAVAAIANQGKGDPYTAFARIAAMAAAMGALLASIGTGIGGGSSSGNSSSYAGTASAQNSSGVLGAGVGTGSNSIADSYAMLKDTYDLEDTKLTRIYMELRDLNRNITGLVTSIVRTGGIGMSVDVGTEMGAAHSQFDTVFGSSFPAVDLLSNYVTDFIGSLFGGDTSTWVSAIGIAFGEATVQSLLDGIPIVAKEFAVISTSVSGGLFSSGSFSQEWRYEDLDTQVNAEINKIFVSMSKTLLAIGEGLGTDLQQVYDYVFKAQTTPDLLGMSTDQMNKALNDYFSGIMDTAVNDLFGEILAQYQQIDESLLETAVRIISDKETILQMLEMTGHAFAGTDEEAIALSETLIGLAGDLSALTEAASIYYDKFYSDAEKQLDLQKQLSDAMLSINQMSATSITDPGTGEITTTSPDLILPATRDAYKALVEGLDLTTTAGQEAYVALLQLSGAADQYYSYLEAEARVLSDYNNYYLQTMGLSSDLGTKLAEITDQYNKATAAATARGESEDYLAHLQQESTDMKTKVTQDWVASEIAYYNQMMGLSSDLAATIDGISAHYDAAIRSAIAAGMSEEELAAIRQAETNVTTKATADYWQGALDYYNGLMKNTTALEKQIDAVNKAFEGYIKSAEDAGLSTQELAAAQAAAIAKLKSDWLYSMVMPFITIAADLINWAQKQEHVSTFDMANTTYETQLAMIAASGDDAQTKTENALKALQDFFTTVITGLEQTYEALLSMKSTLKADIENIVLSGMSAPDQAAFYAKRAFEGYQAFSTLLDEDIPAAVDKVRADILKYYDLEKQTITDKYNTEIDALKAKNAVELQNIQAVRDKLLSLTYSSYNLALPTAKAVSAGGDYASMLAAAKTGDANSVAKYLSFVDTYLQASQDAYKSSSKYQEIYSQVMADIASLDTNPTATIEDLASIQNQLIEDQTKAMKDELAALDKNVVDALNILNDTIDARIETTVSDLAAALNLLKQVIAAGFPTTASSEQPGKADGYNSALTTDAVTAFYADPASIFTDNIVTTNELLLVGITTQYNQMANLIQIASTISNYLYWIGKAGWDLNHAAGVPGYADGGVAYGPSTGYPAILHGTEAVIPLKNGSVPVSLSGGAGGYNDPEIKKLIQTLVIQGGSRQNVTLVIENGRAFKGYIQTTADELDQNRYDKGIKNRNYQ